MVQAYVGGVAPRSETYMRPHWDHAKGFLDDAALQDARREEERRWQEAQRDAGLGLISPSYVGWEDIFRPLTALDGCEAGALTRTFETNTFHRQPVLTGPVPEDGLEDAVRALRPDGPWVLTLPSPYDFAARADIQDANALDSVAACLNAAARLAVHLDAQFVRFQEPSALYPGHDADPELLSRLLGAATSGLADRSILHLTQGDPGDRPAVLEANPCRGLAIEADPDLVATDLSGTALTVAVVRGEQSLIEDPQAAHEAAVATADATRAELWGVTNGWDLEHVPFDVAVAKLDALARVCAVEVEA